METFRQILEASDKYATKALKELGELIATLDGKLKSDEAYEKFFEKLGKSGLDEMVLMFIDNNVGNRKWTIIDAAEKEFQRNYERTGTEVRAAAEAAIAEIQKVLRKL